MNDLDLRTALHRDADLVGEPPADLLDQLAGRRRAQTRRRAGVIGAVAAVVVVAGGIPVGASILATSDAGPATERLTPTPSVTAEVEPSPTPAPTPSPSPAPAATPSPEVTPLPDPPVVTRTVPPVVPGTPATEVDVPAVEPDPVCDWAAMDAALPADSATHTYTLHPGDGELCVGPWAAAGYTEVEVHDGVEHGDGQAGIFHHVDGAWTFLDRYADPDDCVDPDIPEPVWQRACNVD